MPIAEVGKRCATALVAVVSFATLASAAPQISSLSIRGLQIGGRTSITIDGSGLQPDPHVVVPIPGLSAQVSPDSTDTRVIVDIELEESVAAGIYPLRVRTDDGISNAIAVGIDRLPQKPYTAEIDELPVALHGVLQGSSILETEFDGKHGMQLTADVESRRLGGKLNPVIRLLDASGRQLAWSAARRTIAGDARVTATLPADGRYTVQLHDVLYRGAAPGFFRLKIGELRYADICFPLAVQRGANASLKFAGTNFPPETATTLVAAADNHSSQIPASWPDSPWLTGGRPRLLLSDTPEFVEGARDGNEAIEVPQPSVAINGILAEPKEEDTYLLPVRPESKLRFDVTADRIGSPLDGVLFIRGEDGKQFATNDDRGNLSDPGLDFTVPKDVSKIVVALRDLTFAGGSDYVYRIEVQDLATPDFELTIPTDRINVPAGSTQALLVTAQRKGFNGDIQLDVLGLPDGCMVNAEPIRAGNTLGLISLTATEVSSWNDQIRIIGRGKAGDAALTRVAQTPQNQVTGYRPWLRDDPAFAIARPTRLSISLGDMAEERPVFVGSKLVHTVRIARQDGAKGKVRCSIVTTQAMPKKTIKENNRDKQVDDTDRALRLDGTSVFESDAEQATVAIAIPPDLALDRWAYAIRAELLGEDDKTVLATTLTPPQQFTPIHPFSISTSGDLEIEAKAGEGETGQFVGSVTRHADFNKPLKVTLVGLPKDYPAPTIEVSADETEFQLPVRFPYGTKPGELKNVKLVATSPSDPKPELLVRSNEIAIGRITVVAGEKPAEESKDEPEEKTDQN